MRYEFMPSGSGGGAEWEGGELMMIRRAFERDGIQIKTQEDQSISTT